MLFGDVTHQHAHHSWFRRSVSGKAHPGHNFHEEGVTPLFEQLEPLNFCTKFESRYFFMMEEQRTNNEPLILMMNRFFHVVCYQSTVLAVFDSVMKVNDSIL